MKSITVKQLEAIIARINTMTGSPLQPYARQDDGLFVPCAGCYHLSGAYGGVALHRMSLDKGCTGVSDVFNSGHMTKRDLANRMFAFINGLEAAKNTVNA